MGVEGKPPLAGLRAPWVFKGETHPPEPTAPWKNKRRSPAKKPNQTEKINYLVNWSDGSTLLELHGANFLARYCEEE